ncbi:(Fe-S)-binding protein [Virgibacillus sp. W0181]|uniref:(Fe-S)-binding protein n=1 Tax=Virgibacillus sp. W0181 TaxID=3391581 RepID=UPI003F44B901
MKVSLFITCLGEVFYPDVGKDVVEILERLDCEVDFVKDQTCCGQPAFNSGYHRNAIKTAKHMIEVFSDSLYVVTPSGSCAAMINEYELLLKDEGYKWQEAARRLKAKTFEFTQFLVDVLEVEDVGATYAATATYHTSCHMTRLLGVKEAPFKLLKNVKKLNLMELGHAYDCCGFGGTFAVKMSPISEQMVDEKIHHIEQTGASVLVGADSGCLMNIKGRIDRLGKPIEVKHIAQILNKTDA